MKHLHLLAAYCLIAWVSSASVANTVANTTQASDHVKDAVDRSIAADTGLLDTKIHISPPNETHPLTDHSATAHHGHGVKVAQFKFEYVKVELVLAIFFVLIGLFKLLYHQFSFPRNVLPESCCLIALGCAIGAFVRFIAGNESAEAVRFLEFDSKIFFFYLLPPIILEAAYDLKDKAFVDNFGTIVLYAVVGTVLNIAIVGGGLIFFGYLGIFGTFGINPLDCLVFASLIAAVDPVAVLAIFKEVGVNKMLYFMVFGESLLNDAVTVVCYNLISEFKELETIRLYDCFLGFVAFLCVAFGGLVIGIFFGLLSAFITKYTLNVRVVEPVVCFGMAFLSYVCSELFHFSGIIGVIACGLFQTHYTMANLSSKSFISIMYITKVVSSINESLIFIILGVMLLNENSFFFDDWHPPFAIFSLIFCIIARFCVVWFLTYIVNRFTGGVRYISFQEQFIMAYGGLRGAVSFSLAFMIDNAVTSKPTLLAATYLVIMFTVFIQGSSMKFLVKLLNITLDHKHDNFRLFREFNKGMVNHMTQGMEDLIGAKHRSIIEKLRHLSNDHLRPCLIRGYKRTNPEDKLLTIEENENIKDTLKSVPSVSSFKRQATLDEMTERGFVDCEMLDEYDGLMDHHKTEADSAVDELMNDPLHIQALVNNTCYPDRNLVYEALHERRESIASGVDVNQRTKALQLARMGLTEAYIRKRRGFRRAKPEKKKSVTRSLLQAAASPLGVSSHAVSTTTIEEVDETGASDTEVSPPETARTIKTSESVFAECNGKSDPSGAATLLKPDDASKPLIEPEIQTTESSTSEETAKKKNIFHIEKSIDQEQM
uniref:Sodium/hydrogen exchanger n=1 Tax=Panagrellus redivivus TaxID=6233 RepID=A0A7E4UYB7_PANRE